jgi:hypothetical protein
MIEIIISADAASIHSKLLDDAHQNYFENIFLLNFM